MFDGKEDESRLVNNQQGLGQELAGKLKLLKVCHQTLVNVIDLLSDELLDKISLRD